MAERKQEIIFITGKGGVGKSLIAAAKAQALTDKGLKVLLAEIGDTSYYQDFWRLQQTVGHDPIRCPNGFDLVLWSGDSCLREYVLFYLKVQRLYKLFFENKIMRSLVNVAPGLSEIAILGKITSGIRHVGPQLPYDVIIVDCFATGHALALLRAPLGMMAAIGFGPMGHHSRDINAVLRDNKICSFQIVTLLEEMPVTEALELRAHLRSLLGQEAGIIVNKVLPTPLSMSELDHLQAEIKQHPLIDFLHFLKVNAESDQRFSASLKSNGVESEVRVPLIFSVNAQDLVAMAAGELRHA